MTKRKLLLLAPLAVLALVLSPLGATAAPLFSHAQIKKIKKIANKQITKRAPGLSVASAATAGNATNLAGQPASSYLTKSYVFPLTGTSPDSTINWTLPVPAGKYLVNYNVAASVAGAPGFFVCYFGTFGAKRVAALGSLSGNWWVTGAGYIDTTVTPAVLECNTTSAPITVPGPSVAQSQVVLTRVDDVSTVPTVGSKAAGRSSGSAVK